MSLGTYSELQTAIGTLLNRTDLTASIPDFIALCEANLKRELRRTVVRQQYSINAQAWTMPSEIGELLSLRLVSDSPTLDLPIAVVTPEDAATYRAGVSDTAARPARAFIAGRDVIFAPTPDTAYTLEVTYVAALVPLSDQAPTNVVLTEAPDAYLYGSAVHAAPFLGDDDRLPMWQALSASAIDALNRKRDREEYGASLRPMRLARVFG